LHKKINLFLTAVKTAFYHKLKLTLITLCTEKNKSFLNSSYNNLPLQPTPTAQVDRWPAHSYINVQTFHQWLSVLIITCPATNGCVSQIEHIPIGWFKPAYSGKFRVAVLIMIMIVI
jgi:hypothetical protein